MENCGKIGVGGEGLVARVRIEIGVSAEFVSRKNDGSMVNDRYIMH